MKGFLKGTTSVKLPQSLYVESTEDFDLISAKKAKPIPLYHFSSSGLPINFTWLFLSFCKSKALIF
jgi:hypothetical protein